MAPCMISGCICCYDACDCDNCVCCCVGRCDCLCIRYSECLACNAKPRGCGVSSDESKGEICMLGLFCVEIGIINPNKLYGCARQQWCCYSVHSCPFNKEYVDTPVCASYGIMCLPECGCCSPPPECPALKSLLSGESEPLAPVVTPMDRISGAGSTVTTEILNPDGSKKVVKTVVNPDGSKIVTESIVGPPPPEGATAPPGIDAKPF